MKIHSITPITSRSLISILVMFLGILLLDSNLFGQQLEIEWNGSKEELIRLIEGGKVRFAIEGQTASVPDRITFRIKTELGDTLVDVMTLIEEGYLRLEKDPIHPQDAATKAYVDQMAEILLNAGINGVVQDIDGNTYKTIKIGEQVWMAENLKTTRYNDGTPILNVTDNTAWSNLSTPGYCWYNNDSTLHAKIFGALYNYYAVADTNSLNICPVGWDVPTDSEWTIFTDFLENNGYGYEGSGADIGKSAATSFRWTSSVTGGHVGNDLGSNNSSGFLGLPGGFRFFNGSYFNLGLNGSWWSSTESGANTWTRNLIYNDSNVSRSINDRRNGFSVRCMRD